MLSDQASASTTLEDFVEKYSVKLIEVAKPDTILSRVVPLNITLSRQNWTRCWESIILPVEPTEWVNSIVCNVGDGTNSASILDTSMPALIRSKHYYCCTIDQNLLELNINTSSMFNTKTGYLQMRLGEYKVLCKFNTQSCRTSLTGYHAQCVASSHRQACEGILHVMGITEDIIIAWNTPKNTRKHSWPC